MKKQVLIAIFFLSFICARAQDTYTIDGQSIELKTAVEGPLDLLWNTVSGQYRYFVRTDDNQLVELKNTKNADNHYQKEYLETLKNLTNNTLGVYDVDMTLPSLARFIDRYNATKDPDYLSSSQKGYAEFRIGVFGGITNSPFVGNPENETSTVIGGEVELLTGSNQRHSGYVQLRHVAEKKDFKYKTTELSLGYRYRFIKTSAVSVYGDAKFATLNFSKFTHTYEDNNLEIVTEEVNDTAFDVPIIVGVGADWKISNSIYANFSYNQLFAVFFKNQGNFSTDITVGLKFKLN